MEVDRKEAFRQRTKKFASVVIRFYCELPKNRMECQVIGKQLLRSGTSVAANYREASRARSNAEFVSKIELCTQETDESELWLELLREDCGIKSDRLDWLLDESNQLISYKMKITLSSLGRRGLDRPDRIVYSFCIHNAAWR